MTDLGRNVGRPGTIMGDAERIRTLRERLGRSSAEVAALVGLEDMEYFDLEFHDDELSTVPSLAVIKRLASVLGVPTPALFMDEFAEMPTRRISYAELASSVKALIADGISQEALEDDIGWALNDFLESEAKALSEYGVDFLKALCERLGVGWTEALP